jgi:hypothetical protein
MAITNIEAITFCNEQIRPMAEKLRNQYYELKSMYIDWQASKSSLFPNEEDNMVEDGRETITQLSGADVNRLVNLIANYLSQIETGTVLESIQKPCVRAFRGV